ncbi:MAG: hypothetical protein WBQ94_01175 [Terracidiphilus sp.]
MEFDPTNEMDQFEQEVHQALERRPAPPGLKRKVMDRRSQRRTEHRRSHIVIWQRLAASLLLVAVLCGGFLWREREEKRKGEAARQQVLTALRITGRALNEMKTQLAAKHRSDEE